METASPYDSRSFDELVSRLAQSAAVSDWGMAVYDQYVGQLSHTLGVEIDALADEAGVTATSRVLELGCGSGGLGCLLVQRTGCELLGIDWSPAAIRLAAARASDHGLAGRARFRLGDLRRLELADGAYDVLLTIDSLQFADHRLLSSIAPTLASDGRFAALQTVLSAATNGEADGIPLLTRADIERICDDAGLVRQRSSDHTEGLRALVERMVHCWRSDLPRIRADIGADLASGRLAEDEALLRLLHAGRLRRVLHVASGS
jgi:SAM-dependent methyltransferase